MPPTTPKCPTPSGMPNMTIGDINKWISGETELFLIPRATPPCVSTDSSPGAKSSSAHLSIRKFAHPAIIAVVGAFSAVAWVSSVSFMQYSAETFPASDAKSQPSEDGAAFTREIAVIPTPAVPLPNQPTTTMLSNAQLAAFLSQVGMWYDQRTKAATAPERKSSPPQRASRRHWPRYSFRAQSDR